jgi:demethylmenaquinone methyltransferase/2-methoxy-6-polyprenyl-1,4-benzoquinol methylase
MAGKRPAKAGWRARQPGAASPGDVRTRTKPHPPQTDQQLADYYARRAPEMEEAFGWPERSADIARLRRQLPRLVAGLDVLEIACGTGYWTQELARTARSVTATDINEEMLSIARTKDYSAGRVELLRQDAWRLTQLRRRFDAAVAMFWWSHLPRGRIRCFLDQLGRVLRPGSLVVLVDNLATDCRRTPPVGFDAEGNAYQRRVLRSGERFDIIKNYPSESELRQELSDFAAGIDYAAFDCLWMLRFRLGEGR